MNNPASSRTTATTTRLDLGNLCHTTTTTSSTCTTDYTEREFTVLLRANTNLFLDFGHYEPTPEHNRRLGEPLCRAIANLHQHRRRHSSLVLLRHVTFYQVDLERPGMTDLLEQFLMAVKRAHISDLTLLSVQGRFPVHILVEFLRDNSHLEFLEMFAITLKSSSSSSSSSSTRGEGASLSSSALPDFSVRLNLDILILHGVLFADVTAVAIFEQCVAQMNVVSLVLGCMFCFMEADCREANRIMTAFQIPAVQHLTLIDYCRIEHFQLALAAGLDSVTDLIVVFNFDTKKEEEHDQTTTSTTTTTTDDSTGIGGTTGKLELVAGFVRDAPRLCRVAMGHIPNDPNVQPYPPWSRTYYQKK